MTTDISDLRKVLTLASGPLMLVLLWLWQGFMVRIDFALLFLAPIFIVLFLASLKINSSVYRKRAEIVIRKESRLARWFTGHLRAVIGSILFSFVATVLLAAFVATASAFDWACLLGVTMISYLVFALTVGNLRIHLTSAFMRIGSVWTVNVTMIVLVLPIVAFLYWSFQPLPTYLEGWTWMEAAREGLARLPEHRGWISEVLAWFYAVEYLKLWLSLQIDSHPLLSGIVYSFDATLTLFIAARANAVSLAAFLAGREGDK